jgi:nucleoid-associated protein EbfC
VTDAEGGVPGFDIGSLFSQLGDMQRNLREAQEEAAAAEVVGTAGGGAVKVKVSGGLEFLEVKIDPSVVDPSDIEMLEDLVLAAIRDGMDQASSLASRAIGRAGLPGLGGPGLPGLPGLPAMPGLEGLFGTPAGEEGRGDES